MAFIKNTFYKTRCNTAVRENKRRAAILKAATARPSKKDKPAFD